MTNLEVVRKMQVQVQELSGLTMKADRMKRAIESMLEALNYEFQDQIEAYEKR